MAPVFRSERLSKGFTTRKQRVQSGYLFMGPVGAVLNVPLRKPERSKDLRARRASAKFCPIRGAQIPSFRRTPESRYFNLAFRAGLVDPGFRRGDDQGGQSVPDKIMDNCHNATQRGPAA